MTPAPTLILFEGPAILVWQSTYVETVVEFH